MKPVVQYRRLLGPLVEGECAFCLPLDHPSELVSNTKAVMTSPVKVILGGGEFETDNSIYKPVAVH